VQTVDEPRLTNEEKVCATNCLKKYDETRQFFLKAYEKKQAHEKEYLFFNKHLEEDENMQKLREIYQKRWGYRIPPDIQKILDEQQKELFLK
jgi:hypothetical protein